MASLGPAPKAQFFTADGQPLVGGKVYTYAAGTTTPLATYTSSSGAAANTNPIILDGRGECNIWFSPSSTYKIKLTDSNDVEIYVVDNITSSGYVSGGTIVNSSIVNSTISNPTLTNGSISGATIDNAIIGGTTPTTATFTTFSGAWDSIPAGTKMLFVQTAAPTGWTKLTTDDNKALRIVSGTAGTGGSVAFTTAFSSQSISGTVGDTTLDITQIPSHSHSYTAAGGVIVVNGGTASAVLVNATGNVTGAAGGGLPHTHSLTTSAINLAVQYVDAIIAVKN
jgi:hypothetical protein